jgi:hypothetical protein
MTHLSSLRFYSGTLLSASPPARHIHSGSVTREGGSGPLRALLAGCYTASNDR